MNLDAYSIDLGKCCQCGRQDAGVLIMLHVKSPEPGIGCWGCVECGLPLAGAVAVICNQCAQTAVGREQAGQKHDAWPTNACLGSPRDNRRVPMSLLKERFDHDYSKHKDESGFLHDRLSDQVVEMMIHELFGDFERRMMRHGKN